MKQKPEFPFALLTNALKVGEVAQLPLSQLLPTVTPNIVTDKNHPNHVKVRGLQLRGPTAEIVVLLDYRWHDGQVIRVQEVDPNLADRAFHPEAIVLRAPLKRNGVAPDGSFLTDEEIAEFIQEGNLATPYSELEECIKTSIQLAVDQGQTVLDGLSLATAWITPTRSITFTDVMVDVILEPKANQYQKVTTQDLQGLIQEHLGIVVNDVEPYIPTLLEKKLIRIERRTIAILHTGTKDDRYPQLLNKYQKYVLLLKPQHVVKLLPIAQKARDEAARILGREQGMLAEELSGEVNRKTGLRPKSTLRPEDGNRDQWYTNLLDYAKAHGIDPNRPIAFKNRKSSDPMLVLMNTVWVLRMRGIAHSLGLALREGDFRIPQELLETEATIEELVTPEDEQHEPGYLLTNEEEEDDDLPISTHDQDSLAALAKEVKAELDPIQNASELIKFAESKQKDGIGLWEDLRIRAKGHSFAEAKAIACQYYFEVYARQQGLDPLHYEAQIVFSS